MQFKAVSFNMKRTLLPYFRNTWMRRRDAICSFFEAETPDIVGTQELLISYIEKTEHSLPEYGWVGEGRKGGKNGEYTAIFYKKSSLKLIDWGVFWLSKKPEKAGSRSWFTMAPRTCTWALFESTQDGGRIRVYNTHLDVLSPLARKRGLGVIAKHIEMHGQMSRHVILMGDFNATPTSSTLNMLHESAPMLVDGYYSIDTATDGRTYHGFRGKTSGRPVDYIFMTPELDISSGFIDRRIYDNRYPSDHYPVVMVMNTRTT